MLRSLLRGQVTGVTALRRVGARGMEEFFPAVVPASTTSSQPTRAGEAALGVGGRGLAAWREGDGSSPKTAGGIPRLVTPSSGAGTAAVCSRFWIFVLAVACVCRNACRPPVRALSCFALAGIAGVVTSSVFLAFSHLRRWSAAAVWDRARAADDGDGCKCGGAACVCVSSRGTSAGTLM